MYACQMSCELKLPSLPTFVFPAIPLLLLGVIVSHIHYPQLASMLCCTSYSHTCMQPHPTLVYTHDQHQSYPTITFLQGLCRQKYLLSLCSTDSSCCMYVSAIILTSHQMSSLSSPRDCQCRVTRWLHSSPA